MEQLKSIINTTKVGQLIKPILGKTIEFYRTRLMSDKKYVEVMFKKRMGYKLDLNNPITLNEKIQWLKLNDRTKQHTIRADKYLVREYVKSIIGPEYLVPLILHTKEVHDLDPTKLPDYPFIIKANHTSGDNIIVMDKNSVDWNQIHYTCETWLKKNFYFSSKEWQYKNIKPKLLIEKLLLSNLDELPNDYKVHCFHGKAKMIQVDVGRGTQNHTRNWYNTSWEREPYKWSSLLKNHLTDPSTKEIEKPKSLTEMIFLSEKLSQEFKYVRIDWYDLNGKLFFGEFTFHHDSGFRPVEPIEWDKKLGELIKIK